MNFLAELRRRNVIRVAGFYLVAAWLVVQVAETLLPIFDAPGWVLKVLVAVLAVGFIPTAVFAWVYELTPEGLKRESEIDRSQSIVDHTARKLDIAVIVLLVLAIGLFAFGQAKGPDPASRADFPDVSTPPDAHEVPGATATTASTASQPPPNSIAVLPFVNMSAESEQEYFSDGISEEILNVLARTPGLQVAARTSSFGFKGGAPDVPRIARELNVRLVLEGSVRKQGERVRITAQLIDAPSGYHLWSRSFDRELRDIFAIQDEIAGAVADALQVTLGGTAAPAAGSVADLAAYDLYLQGIALWQARGEANMRRADALFRDALGRDPKLARAWAGLGLVHAVLPEWSTAPAEASAAIARDAAERALALDPGLPEPYIVLAFLALTELRLDTSRAMFERALALAPSHATGHQWFGFMLAAAGDFAQAIRIGERAAALDPKSPIVRAELANSLYAVGRFDEERALCDSILAEDPDYSICHFFRFNRAYVGGDREAMRMALTVLARLRDAETQRLAEAMAEALDGGREVDALAARVATLADGFTDPDSPLVLDDHATVQWLTAVGRKDLAVERLARHATRFPHYARSYLAGGRHDDLRCEPGYAEISRRLNVPFDAAAGPCAGATP